VSAEYFAQDDIAAALALVEPYLVSVLVGGGLACWDYRQRSEVD
jgi:hypothetical protein